MADTENGTTNPAQEITDQTDTKVEDSNNNSGKVSQAPEDPASSKNMDSEEVIPREDQPAPVQDECNQGEYEQRADEQKERAERENSNCEEGEKSESPRQDPPGDEEPKQDEQEKSNLSESKRESLTEQDGEETEGGKSKEETIKDPDDASQEKVGEAVAVQNSESVDVDEAHQKDEGKPVNTELPREASEQSVVSSEVINETKEQDEIRALDSNTQEQTGDLENSNEDENDDKMQHEAMDTNDKSKDDHEQPAGEVEVAREQEVNLEADKPTGGDSTDNADTPFTLTQEKHSTDVTDHVQVSTATELADTDSYDGTDFEVKYKAARKDIEELRSLNKEMQQRLNDSENREREQKQAGLEAKDGVKVQTVYLARELSQQKDTEKYLREKLAEVLQEKEESEQKAKDLELRLKRFVKDDQAKDAKMAKMEDQLRSLTRDFEELEKHLDEKTLEELGKRRKTREDNGEAATAVHQTNKASAPPVPKSKTCVIV